MEHLKAIGIGLLAIFLAVIFMIFVIMVISLAPVFACAIAVLIFAWTIGQLWDH